MENFFASDFAEDNFLLITIGTSYPDLMRADVSELASLPAPIIAIFCFVK